MPQRTGALRLIVNGSPREVAADGETTLLTVLRDELGLLGTRNGCLGGRCGACTVHLDGKAVASCDTPLWSVADRRIDTIDGAPEGGSIDRVREVFLDEQAAQCGYCINGIMMRIAALLEAGETDRAAILAELDERHLCRCGAHPRILRALDRLLADAGRAA